jgi:transporter family-2 protein
VQLGDVETNTGDGTASRLLQLLAAVGLGCLVSVQARVSADLAERSDVYSAAWVTVVTGTLILLVVLVGSPHARSGFGRVATAVRSGSLPWWALSGGLAGMFFVVTQGAAAGVLGLAMFGMAVVAGQVVGGLVFDWIGLAGGERRSPTLFRVLGAVLAIAAVSWGAIAGDDSNIDVSLIAMAFVAGLGLAAASGVTGRVHSVARSVVTAGMLNHLVGLAVIVTLPESLTGSSFPSEPWLFIGGIIGPIGVAVGAILVHTLGVLLLGLGMVAGQLVGALVLEMVVPTAGVQASSIIGIVLTLLAVAITSLDGRRRHT